MSDRIASRIDDWSTRSVPDGHRGLHRLADDSFTGAIDATTADVTVVMLNGRVIGVFGGTIESIEEAPLTAHEAPHPSLPLLWVMRETADSPRAQYYTEETPLSEVDDTLASGGFTGFVELSENVLSGDYYQIYYGGRSLSVAFVGQAEQLLTDEAAFDRAADEVGIYKVYDASVSVQDLPERPPEPTADPSSSTDAESRSAPTNDQSPADPTDTESRTTPIGVASRDNSTDQEPPTEPASADAEPTPSAGVTESPTTATSVDDGGSPVGSSDDASGAPAEPASDATAELEAKCERLRAERDELEATVEDLRQTNRELREEVADLEARLEEASIDYAAPEDLTPSAALTKTDLFVRYDSRGEATLDDVLEGPVDRMDLEANLALEHHTQFDADATTVAGDPFRSFLEDTLAFEFAEWLLTALIYEIKETNNEDGLRDLYRSLPAVDRIEFNGEVALDAADTEGDPGSVPFDVIARDQMGAPLIVAAIDGSNDPVVESTIGDLHESTAAAVRSHPTIGAAFAVTASFFEPEALQATAELTGSGLLSFDARRSHVKVTRTEGYHLCLVEVRGQRHHLAVPEL